MQSSSTAHHHTFFRIPKSLLYRFNALFLFTICSIATYGQQNSPRRYVAITFDDLPVVCQCENDAERMEITKKLITTFKKYKMPILAVVNEQKLESNGTVDQPGLVFYSNGWTPDSNSAITDTRIKILLKSLSMNTKTKS